jgi:predicted  nucleic acid-binding Zn-ribbon protein
MTFESPQIWISALGGVFGAAVSLAVRVYQGDQSGAAKLLGEIVRRLEERHADAVRRLESVEHRLATLEVEQGRSGAHQAALDGRVLELRTDFRAASEKLDTISELLATIRSQLELLTPTRARTGH